MGTLTARTQRDIEIDRAIAGRCPRCGSPKTGPGGIRMQDGQPRDVGVSCDTCDYLHDGTQVVYEEFSKMDIDYVFKPTAQSKWYLLVRNDGNVAMNVDVRVEIHGEMMWEWE